MSKAPLPRNSRRPAGSFFESSPINVFEMRDLPGPAGFSNMNTAEMRATFLFEDLFVPGRIKLFGCHVDRAIIGAAVPGRKDIMLPSHKELAAEYFTQRREIGVVNIGGSGHIFIGSSQFALDSLEAAYIGKGNPEISFSSDDPAKPAQFYFVSYPAHTAYPCAKIDKALIESTECGSVAGSNCRTIRKLIHPAGVASCQLVMGHTQLAEGSVWNTMPAHTHHRRSEIYLYFDLPKDGIVVHCLGEPRETRHLMVRDRQAVLSPSWSLHTGVGTTNYSFIWSMGGENQDFADMDAVPMEELM